MVDASITALISREQAEIMVRRQMGRDFNEPTLGGVLKSAHSVGRMEFAELLDAIYGDRRQQYDAISGVKALSGDFADLTTDDQMYLVIRRSDIWGIRQVMRWDNSEPQNLARATWRAMAGLPPNNTHTWYPDPEYYASRGEPMPQPITYPGVERLEPSDLAELCELARRIGGWIDSGNRFVPMAEWVADIGCGLKDW
jgi:hypothetical protein